VCTIFAQYVTIDIGAQLSTLTKYSGVFDHLNGHQVDHQKGATYSNVL
jgi:hypothetical protein